ncbi:HTH-type transcriptional regulator DmlR [Variibacter gotjawalensis]|uniref:HTH-type transcriptional regulator DmlR n=1 Tax=Variibacter gotjawalensis TaxID=1333996 RepID=A0A0S3PV99_9BRAD|nr:LysR family transcriptional regulator [Variibacter gotjawalensis]NIK50068.1 DNA-binding transcriptional LysR family regulator [Variibacter gotjawalensis]RZS46067.1 LysR family transcriptional regulator [Variibacter gotjawalensis]BAT59742.1 HTH-type transcriptional regulator DmlR [Variibacter gotjawalensis]
MRGSQFAELTAFVAVAEHRSFSKAAAQLGIAPSTLSETIRSLEERLGMRLFNRTTRSVASTEAGDRLLSSLQPALDGVGRAIESLNDLRDKPAGTLRITMARSIAAGVAAPVIAEFLAKYPDVTLEMSSDDHKVDIVSARFDAGIRIGEMIEKDMIAQRISDPFPLIAIASPAYLLKHGSPAEPAELHGHRAIRFRKGGEGGLLEWTFERDKRRIDVDPAASYIVNDMQLAMHAAIDGAGITYLPQLMLQEHLDSGALARVLPDWEHTLSGLFVYYPSRRQMPTTLQVFIDFLKSHRIRWQSGTPYAGATTRAL